MQSTGSSIAAKTRATRATAARDAILIVEDDAAVRRMLRNLFESEGYRVHEAATEKDVRKCLSGHVVALVTVDIGLGGENGLDIVRAIRRGSEIPIMLITARAGEVDRVVGLEIGADDYIVKPFGLREVVARTRALIRRSRVRSDLGAADESVRLEFAGRLFDVSGRSLSRASGEEIELTTAEFKLLEALVMRPGRVLSRGQLLDLVDGGAGHALERSIDTLVGRLRRKIEADPQRPTLIKTVRGGGYIFAEKPRPRL